MSNIVKIKTVCKLSISVMIKYNIYTDEMDYLYWKIKN